MNVTDIIQTELELADRIHYVKDKLAFSYSDGDESERYVYDAIRRASDISSNSLELEGGIKDWPSRYHLSRERPLVYRALELPREALVLEVGSGCGAITRFLGETVSQVVALEGSPRRADITRERTRDLSNVIVVCASFADVKFKAKFDFVVCNGVLEYAPMFVEHQDPADELVRLLSQLLKPTGHLIVAIENKFGLRYFSSGKEEHTNIWYDGLEGYARYPHGPITFGYSELHARLSKHCPFVEVLLPLPDYKLPSAVIRAELPDEVDCADLFADLSRYDFGTYIEPHMHERLVLHELQKNRALKLFANSFVMIAGHEPKSLLRENWMGEIHSIKRLSNRTTRTTILKDERGHIRTRKEGVGTAASEPGHALHCEESAWISGVSIHTILARAMLRREGNLSMEERIRESVLAWWKGLGEFRDERGSLSGAALDCIWQNAILRDGSVSFIDKEWVASEPIAPSVLIYRAVAHFVARERVFLHRWSPACQRASEISLMRAVANVVGVPLTLPLVIAAMDQDRDLLASVHGGQSARTKRVARLFVPLRFLEHKPNRFDGLRRLKRMGRSALSRIVPRA